MAAALISTLVSQLKAAFWPINTKPAPSSELGTWSDSSVEYLEKASHGYQWDHEIGGMVSLMLDLAGYSARSKAIHRSWFSESVASSLGPAPTLRSKNDIHWNSFMTDDHTPVELSWSWSEKSATPVVRYAIEPVGWAAGTKADPFNSKATVACLGNSLSWTPTLDLCWYRYFLKALTVDVDDDTIHQSEAQRAMLKNPPSQTFLAFDLDQTTMIVKYYFLPNLKAAVTKQSNLDLVQQSILALPGIDSALHASLNTMMDYLNSFGEADKPKVEIFAIDCISPSKSRLKIYIRSNETSFDSMIRTMTLGGRIPEFSECTIDCIKDLWCKCFGLDNSSHIFSEPLQERRHRTSGLLYYIELKPGSAVPTTKVYLPIRHYAQNDEQIAQGLSEFLTSNGKCLANGQSYYEGVSALCKHRKLEDGLGFHTYVTCAIKKGEVSVNAYFNPQTCSKGNMPSGPTCSKIVDQV